MPSAPDPVKSQAVADSAAKIRDLINSHGPFKRAVAHLNAQTERPQAQAAQKLPFDPLENSQP